MPDYPQPDQEEDDVSLGPGHSPSLRRGNGAGGIRAMRTGAGRCTPRLPAAYFAFRTSAMATSPTAFKLFALILSKVSSGVCQWG